MKIKINTFFKFLISFFLLSNAHISSCMVKDLVTTALGEDTTFLKKTCIGLASYGVLKAGFCYGLAKIYENCIPRISIEKLEKTNNQNNTDIALKEACTAFNLNQNDKKRIHVGFIDNNNIINYEAGPNTIILPMRFGFKADIYKFLAAHELVHVKEKHSKLGQGFSALFPPIYFLAIHSAMNIADHTIKNFAGNSNSTFFKASYPFLSSYIFKNGYVHLFMHTATTPFFITRFYRYLEKRADIKAAQALKTARGGIEFLEIMKPIENKLESQHKTVFTKIKDYWLCKYDHPSTEQRIQYLEEIQKDFDKKEIELR
jgi:hypothetical protein